MLSSTSAALAADTQGFLGSMTTFPRARLDRGRTGQRTVLLFLISRSVSQAESSAGSLRLDLTSISEAVLMNNLINWFVEGIDEALGILVGAAFILLALSSFFGPAKVRCWFTLGDRWRW
jgi:hypothetical protein